MFNVAAAADLESDRLSALHSLRILDTPPEERFDRLIRIAVAAFDTAIATVTLIDEDRQWHKSCVGVGGREDPRAVSFCSVAIETPAALIVHDAREDPRFSENRSSPARRSSASTPASRSRRWTATASARCA